MAAQVAALAAGKLLGSGESNKTIIEQVPVGYGGGVYQSSGASINWNLLFIVIIIILVMIVGYWMYTKLGAASSAVSSINAANQIASLPTNLIGGAIGGLNDLITGGGKPCVCQCRGGKQGDWTTGKSWSDCSQCQNTSTGCWRFCQDNDNGYGFQGWSCNN